ncbi:Protein CROWDED NUCLEI 3 [Hirschfeldia incana]|nr:Protein CROWDED NUCLEI 3 [Hirschfeldia incana]
MFTPQRNPATDRKGKSVAFSDETTTPPHRFGSVDDWRTFREVGLLDEASLERKDIDALIEKNLKLEKELFDYQHNMGLLLIEKKKWTLANEELRQGFDEVNEILKRERNSSLIALSESEKREESLRKALINEKQFVAELERDLKYLQQEYSEVKTSSEAKLAEANDLVMGIKEKALEVDKERAVAEEKLSVVSRKSSELERKLKDVETREKVLQRERLSLATEREAHEAVFYKQREELQEWEKKLTVEEDRLSEVKRSIKHTEERTVESERAIKKKEKSLQEMQRKIDTAKSELKEREESMKKMLNDLSLKEKDFEAMKTKVDLKEKELHELEEKLKVREQMEIGKLLDDQKGVLDSRLQEFEKELEQKSTSLDEELEKKKGEIEKLQVEIDHKEEQLGKREAALEKTEEAVKEKEKDLEARLKAVKEKEKDLKTEEKKLQVENERLLEDKESLRKLKEEIEEIGAETTKEESKIREEYESLRITKEERLEFIRQQSELKQQIDRVKREGELHLKEREELKQDKGRFEKEWEALDEKKADIAREQKEVAEEKEKLRSMQISRVLDDVQMKKESLEANVTINENISCAKKLALKEMEELEYEKLALKKERDEISVEKKQLKKLHDELYKDVADVDALRVSLKEQRDDLVRSKERFAVFLKKVSLCSTCRIPVHEFSNSERVPDAQDDSKSTSFIGKLASAMALPDDSHEPSATEHSFSESKGAEVSTQSEIKRDKPRRGRGRGKSVRGRSQATTTSDSKLSDVKVPRKRQREQGSRITESEQHGDGDSDEGVDSVTTGGRKKKRQTAIPVSLAPAQSRYHLRRHRNVGTEEDKTQESTGAMEKQESVDGDDIRTVPSPKDILTPPQGENKQNGKAETLVEAVRREEIVKVETETEFKDKSTGKRLVEEDPQLEAGGSGEIREHGDEEDDGTFSMIQEENEEVEEEETETDHPGEASIGKKIWVFFTT